MAKKIMQFRYYGESSNKNSPSTINAAKLQSGSAFMRYYPITQLGIQSLPGTQFYLNGSPSPIIIGSTGIYELDLEGLSTITQLSFSPSSVSLIAKNPNAYLIVDTITEDEGGVK